MAQFLNETSPQESIDWATIHYYQNRSRIIESVNLDEADQWFNDCIDYIKNGYMTLDTFYFVVNNFGREEGTR